MGKAQCGSTEKTSSGTQILPPDVSDSDSIAPGFRTRPFEHLRLHHAEPFTQPSDRIAFLPDNATNMIRRPIQGNFQSEGLSENAPSGTYELRFRIRCDMPNHPLFDRSGGRARPDRRTNRQIAASKVPSPLKRRHIYTNRIHNGEGSIRRNCVSTQKTHGPDSKYSGQILTKQETVR